MPFFIVKHVDKTAGVRNSPTQTSSSVFFSHKQYQFRHLNCSPLLTPHPPRPDVIQQHGSSHTAGQLAALLDMGTELQDLTHKATAYWSSCIIEVALRAADIRRHSWRSLWVHTLTCPLDHSSNHHTLAHLINIWIKHLFYYHCTLRDNCLHDCVCCRSAQICYVRLTNFHLCTSLCRYSRLSLDTVSHYRKEEEKKKHPVNTAVFTPIPQWWRSQQPQQQPGAYVTYRSTSHQPECVNSDTSGRLVACTKGAGGFWDEIVDSSGK